jgi:hypothetical protein
MQHADNGVLRAVKSALTNDPKFTAVCAPPSFVEGADCTGEPMVPAGNVNGGEIRARRHDSSKVRSVPPNHSANLRGTEALAERCRDQVPIARPERGRNPRGLQRQRGR